MNTQRVEVLHVTNGDTVVEAVANNLVFHLLPTLQTLLDKNLWRERERLVANGCQLLLVVAETRAQTAKSIGSTNDYWIS